MFLTFISLLMFGVALCVVTVISAPVEDGKWDPQKFGNDGKYIPTDEGKYKHVPNPYIHDNNSYIHENNPYLHDNNSYAHNEDPYETAASQDTFKLVQLEPNASMPFYKEGYYKNNGIKIVSQQQHADEESYKFNFETENKIRANEQAVMLNPNSTNAGIAKAGFYEYIGPDGYKYRVDYTADENGFRPKTSRIETPYSGKWTIVNQSN